jgi:hypothetical protein
MGVGRRNRQLPPLPGAGVDADRFEGDGEETGGHLLARRHDGIIFACVVQDGGFPAPIDQPVGGSGHRGRDNRYLVAGVDLALDVARDVADAVDIGDRRSAEFHDKTGHNFSSQALNDHCAGRAGAKRRVYIPRGSGGCNLTPLCARALNSG